MMISHHDHHRHSAYLLAHVDAAGFSQSQLRRIGNLVLGQRGGLRKMGGRRLQDSTFALHLLCLRLAVIACHARDDAAAEALALNVADGAPTIALAGAWADANPRAVHLLRDEVDAWAKTEAGTGAAPGRRRGRLARRRAAAQALARRRPNATDRRALCGRGSRPRRDRRGRCAASTRRPCGCASGRRRRAHAQRSRRASADGQRPGPPRRHGASPPRRAALRGSPPGRSPRSSSPRGRAPPASAGNAAPGWRECASPPGGAAQATPRSSLGLVAGARRQGAAEVVSGARVFGLRVAPEKSGPSSSSCVEALHQRLLRRRGAAADAMVRAVAALRIQASLVSFR